MKSLSQMAKEGMKPCALMVNRTPIKTENILNQDLTIISVDFAPKIDKKTKQIIVNANGGVETYPVLVFEEYPENFYGAGCLIDKTVSLWLNAYGTLEALNEALTAEGGVAVRFYSQPDKNYTCVEFL